MNKTALTHPLSAFLTAGLEGKWTIVFWGSKQTELYLSESCKINKIGLKIQFQPELNFPFACRRRAGELAGIGDHVSGAIENLCLRRLEIGPIEQIERLGPELQRRAFAPQPPVLEKRIIEIFESRPLRIAAEVPQLPQFRPRKTLGLDVVRRIAGIDNEQPGAGL